MKKNGYTLVELIAMVVVIGILMVITVPNIAGIKQNSKQEIVEEDINKIVSSAKQKINTNKVSKPAEDGHCTVMTLSFINGNDDFKEGANSGTYDMENSYVVVKKVNISSTSSVYKYYVRLLEEKDGKKYLLNFVDYDEYIKNPSDYTFELTDYTPQEHKIEEKFFHIKELINELSGYELCERVTDFGGKV